MKTVIGCLGKAGSGKSTTAEFLRETYGAEILSIARPVKLMAQEIFGFTDEQVFGSTESKETVDPRWGITPRKALQDLATAGRKHLGEDVWIRGLMNYVRGPEAEGTLFVVEDLRFELEAQLIRSLNIMSDVSIDGHVFRLTCEDSVSIDDGTHETEVEVDKVPSHLITTEILSHITPDAAHLKALLGGAMDTLGIARVAQRESTSSTR